MIISFSYAVEIRHIKGVSYFGLGTHMGLKLHVRENCALAQELVEGADIRIECIKEISEFTEDKETYKYLTV